jgi:hypothetical protein
MFDVWLTTGECVIVSGDRVSNGIDYFCIENEECIPVAYFPKGQVKYILKRGENNG